MVTTGGNPNREQWRVERYPGESPFKKVRIVHQAIIDEVQRNVDSHNYTVLLGPPFSEKTRFLQDLATSLADKPAQVSVSVDLRQVRSDSEEEFFASLHRLIEQALHRRRAHEEQEQERQELRLFGPVRSFQHFLNEVLQAQSKHIVLLIDHLNILPQSLVHALLRGLRIHYMERSEEIPWMVSVVMAGSTDLADLSLSPTSPFNIARPVVLPNLNAKQSRALAEETMAAWGDEISENALTLINAHAGGDCYLIPHLCSVAHETVIGYRRPKVTLTVILQSLDKLQQNEQSQWSVREAIRIIEDDANTLMDILDILADGSLPRNRCRQTIPRTGANRLQLSGAVQFDGQRYSIKNGIYRRSLTDHFTPARVGHVLRMTGRWQDAISYLAPRLQHSRPGQARSDLLEAIVQSIYAADHPGKAYRSLVEGIEKGFGLNDVAVYRADVTRGELRLMAHSPASDQLPDRAIDLLDHSQVEAQTFHENNHALHKGETAHRLIAALTPELRPIGIVTVDTYTVPERHWGGPPDLGELLRFLRHAASAIERVTMRSAFQEIGRAVLDAGPAYRNLHRVLLTVSNALGADFAALYLLDGSAQQLVMEASSGRAVSEEEQTIVGLKDEHPITAALNRFRGDSLTGRVNTARMGREGMRILLPLAAAGEELGLLDLHFLKMRHPQMDSDYSSTLITFADQVAIAVYNTVLFERTDKALARRVQELEAARLEIQRLSDQELHEVAFALSHRLSNAMGDVPYNLEVVRDNGAALSSNSLAALERIESRFVSILGLIEPLQEITQMSRRPFRHLDLRSVVREAAHRVLPRDGILAYTPDHEQALGISGDRSLLADAFQSVIENACEAMETGGQLEITYALRPQHVEVRITDTGPGMSPELIARIFELGYSTKDESRSTRGTGLYSARRILRRHSGEIACTSTVGAGTTFILSLPLIGQEE